MPNSSLSSTVTATARRLVRQPGRRDPVKRRWTILMLVPVLLSAMSLAACGSGTPAAEPIKLGYNLWVGDAGVFVADKKKLFSEAGVDVEMVRFANPIESVQALISGKVDVAKGTLADAAMLQNSQAQDDPIKVFAVTDLSSGADGIVASPGITSVKDLKGKDVAVTVGAVNHVLLNHALTKAGMTSGDVNIIDTSPEQAGSDLIAGKVDAAVSWEPFLAEAIAKGNKLIYSSTDAPELIADVLVTRESTLKNRKEGLLNLVRGISDGVGYLAENKADGTEIVAQALGTTAANVSDMLNGVTLITFDESKRLMTTDIDQFTSAIDQINDVGVQFGLMEKPADANSLLDSSLFE